jgi:chromosomal replication initiator protein
MSEIKEKIKKILIQNNFSEETIKVWFDPLGIELDGEKIYIKFQHKFLYENYKTKFKDIIENTLQLDFKYKIIPLNNNTKKIKDNKIIIKENKKHSNNNFTFKNFIYNKKNHFPVISAKEICKHKIAKYNPFVIYGESSTGKTHLLKAIVYEILKYKPDEKILFINSDELNNKYIIQFNKNHINFKQYINNYNYLIIDDFQEVLNLDDLQRELVTVFDLFYEQNKQMIFSYTGKYLLLDKLDKKLKSRLEWGVIVNLKKPDLDIRTKFIHKFCEDKKLNLSNEQILTLAQKFKNLRNIKGILLKILAYTQLINNNLKEKDFFSILNTVQEKRIDNLTFENIIDIVADEMSLDREDILSSKREKEIVKARQVCMFLCRKLLKYSYPEIGKFFGGKDHSTVIYSVKKIQKLKEDSNIMKSLLKNLEQRCSSLEN